LSSTSLNKRHDLYLIASLWVVATQVRASFVQVSHQVGRKARFKAELNFKNASFQKRQRGESERWHRSSAGCERVQALAGEKKAKMLGESDR
jgi:hypothetical protein